MKSVSIGDIQKNISLLTQSSNPFTIIDKRKNKKVAIVYPIKSHSIISSIAGKYKDRVKPCKDLERAKEIAIKEMIEDKYGLSN
jgi:ACT domain-containing protein